MDFYKIKERNTRHGVEIYPDFKICRSQDLMVRGKSFYAIWDEELGLWSTDEYDVQRLVDADLARYAKERGFGESEGHKPAVKYLGDFSSSSWLQFRNYIGHLTDNSHQLDEKLVFANTEVTKHDYISRRLPYPLRSGSLESYVELISTLYDAQERDKLEWAIGAIVAGDSVDIQKFLVLHGPAGAGKSTVLQIIQWLFPGYYTTFEAKALTGSNNAFATEVFRGNPLVAIQHDGDLSRIEDNSKLNSIISHEEMTMNEKYKPSYTSRINAFLFMGTNKPVKITDAKSGIIRRLIDVSPSGRRLSFKRYQTLMSQISFELGAIAQHCLEVYRSMGKDFYSNYKPLEMMMQTDVFFNFVEESFDVFNTQAGVSLTQAYAMYKEYCQDTLIEYKLPQYKFREELKNYFHHFTDRGVVDEIRVRNWYSGFKIEMFSIQPKVEETSFSLVMDEYESILDTVCADQPAQYATEDEIPEKFWSNKERLMWNPLTKQREMMVPPDSYICNTTLKDIDTTKIHYVKPPLNHIVIDFDLKGDDGNKSAELNLEAASKWPPTYAEYSKGGHGIHLHYIYDGDVHQLSRIYSEGIEIKVFVGDSSLRRRLTKCNNIPVSTISGGLPLKEKKMIHSDGVQSEKGLRTTIEKTMRKEIHAATKPSVDFIHKILEDAYNSDLSYDVTDLRSRILAFANNSTNQALYCIKLVQSMQFASKDRSEKIAGENPVGDISAKDDRLVFFDVEVFPNLFVVCWKYADTDTVVRMINPEPHEIEELCKYKLVGFNCRRYDNHILYGRIMGYDNERLYKLSQKIIDGSPNAYFGEAYNLSYVDIYDYAAIKQSLKKWQIELGIRHLELGLPWDQPVDEDLWDKVAEYCDNDVISTEATHKHLIQDFNARLLLSELSGLPVNSTTQNHTAKIIFQGDRDAKDEFIYTDLMHGEAYQGIRENRPITPAHETKAFPGYLFELGKSTYRDETVGEGGYVYAEPGMYENVAVLDVASMHPTSIKVLDLFGSYTQNFVDLMDARLAIKKKDIETASKLLNGALKPYLGSDDDLKALSYALKIVINIVYGLTSARFDNPFKDPRNKDNIVAKRGALFMIDLKNLVQDHGYQVVHIKTDSIKIPNADQKIIDIINEYGRDWGYTFEHEETYKKFCLVNDAVYIAKKSDDSWDAVGAQFKHPYVFKTLFTREPIELGDISETKSVSTLLYLDFNTDEDIKLYHTYLRDLETPAVLAEQLNLPESYDVEKLRFIGKAGSFVPVERDGGVLFRKKDGFYHSATGASGYRWVESEMIDPKTLETVDWVYFHKLGDAAIENISQYGDFDAFVS